MVFLLSLVAISHSKRQRQRANLCAHLSHVYFFRIYLCFVLHSLVCRKNEYIAYFGFQWMLGFRWCSLHRHHHHHHHLIVIFVLFCFPFFSSAGRCERAWFPFSNALQNSFSLFFFLLDFFCHESSSIFQSIAGIRTRPHQYENLLFSNRLLEKLMLESNGNYCDCLSKNSFYYYLHTPDELYSNRNRSLHAFGTFLMNKIGISQINSHIDDA